MVAIERVGRYLNRLDADKKKGKVQKRKQQQRQQEQESEVSVDDRGQKEIKVSLLTLSKTKPDVPEKSSDADTDECRDDVSQRGSDEQGQKDVEDQKRRPIEDTLSSEGMELQIIQDDRFETSSKGAESKASTPSMASTALTAASSGIAANCNAQVTKLSVKFEDFVRVTSDMQEEIVEKLNTAMKEMRADKSATSGNQQTEKREQEFTIDIRLQKVSGYGEPEEGDVVVPVIHIEDTGENDDVDLGGNDGPPEETEEVLLPLPQPPRRTSAPAGTAAAAAVEDPFTSFAMSKTAAAKKQVEEYVNALASWWGSLPISRNIRLPSCQPCEQ